MAVHTFNPGTQDGDAGGSQYIELQDCQSEVHRETRSQKITNKKAGRLEEEVEEKEEVGRRRRRREKEEEEEGALRRCSAVRALAVRSEG